MDLKCIGIEDREIFNRYYDINKYPNSEYNFSNLFMWKDTYNLKYCECSGFLIVFGYHSSIGHYCTFPVGSGDLAYVVNKIVEFFKAQDVPFNMRPLTKPMCEALEREFPGRFEFAERREYHDYVYSVKELIELKGKRLHSKRNHLNSFKSTYNYSYEAIGRSNLEECKNAALDFIGIRGGEDDERKAVAAIFDNYFELGVKGAVLRVDGKPVAVTVGEDFHGTVLIHIEKADTNYRGVYAAINQMFLEHEWSGYDYVNREEDMGIEGLRKAKLSYIPAYLIEKYSVSLK